MDITNRIKGVDQPITAKREPEIWATMITLVMVVSAIAAATGYTGFGNIVLILVWVTAPATIIGIFIPNVLTEIAKNGKMVGWRYTLGTASSLLTLAIIAYMGWIPTAVILLLGSLCSAAIQSDVNKRIDKHNATF